MNLSRQVDMPVDKLEGEEEEDDEAFEAGRRALLRSTTLSFIQKDIEAVEKIEAPLHSLPLKKISEAMSKFSQVSCLFPSNVRIGSFREALVRDVDALLPAAMPSSSRNGEVSGSTLPPGARTASKDPPSRTRGIKRAIEEVADAGTDEALERRSKGLKHSYTVTKSARE